MAIEQQLKLLLREEVYWLPFENQKLAELKAMLSKGVVVKQAKPATVSNAVVNDSIAKLTADLTDCQRCALSADRQNIVIGRGSDKADLMFVGEAPGASEDVQGIPFVGRAGKLLDKIIEAMGLTPEDIYIANINKCRPPGNRNPKPEEVAACMPFLRRQIAIIQPKVICALGSVALQSLMQSEVRISQVRGEFQDFEGTPLMPTFHPAYLLRNPAAKKQVWQDVQKIIKFLGREVPKRSQTNRVGSR